MLCVIEIGFILFIINSVQSQNSGSSYGYQHQENYQVNNEFFADIFWNIN